MVCTSLTCFCGQQFAIKNEDSFSFSQCFEMFIFVLGPFSFLALSSAYFIGNLRPPDVSLRTPSSFSLRKLCTGITLILTICGLLTDVIIYKQSITAVTTVSYCIRIVALLIHLVFLWRLCLIHFDYKRGPMIVTLFWFFTLPFYIVSLERTIADLVSGYKDSGFDFELHRTINLFFLAGMIGCQLGYLVGIVQGNPQYKTVSIISCLSVSSENLLPSEDSDDRYSDVGFSDLPLMRSEGPCPVDSAWFFSKLFFCWVQPLMRKGSKRLLQKESAVYQLPSELNTSKLCNNFIDIFETVKLKNETTQNTSSNLQEKPKRNLLKSLLHLFGVKYFLLGILKFGADALGFGGPIFLNLLVSFVENNEPIAVGCYYAIALFGCTLIGSLLLTHFDYQVNKLSIAIKTSLIGTVYSKAMHSKPVFLGTYSTGEITNFMSTDINRVVNFCPSFHQFWSLPFQVIITLFLLYRQVGIVFLSALGLTLLMILFNRYLAKQIGKYNEGLMEHKDNRVKLMTEILLGIRVVKFNVWEENFTEEINSIRSKELKNLRGIKYFDALCVYLWATTPVLISLLIFSIYAATGHSLTAAKVFTVVALINMLISPLNAFPWVINGLMEAWISIDRLEKYASLPTFNIVDYYDDDKSFNENDHVLQIENGAFAWNSDVVEEKDNNLTLNNDSIAATDRYSYKDKDLLLQQITVKIFPGQFIGVYGTVGSGKSSLLSAICAEMEKLNGFISLRDAENGVALVSQEPWIQHASIKENILWGQPYDEQLYQTTVACCALKDDFRVLPNGDMTEVGENGVTLSGGQKARISLARAVYQDKSFYLLDDPLSAVDQHVAAHLYHQCIAGVLKNQTRILCTHHTKYLRNADVIIEMEQGKIKSIGSATEILQLNQTEEDASVPTSMNELTETLEQNKANTLMSNEEKAVGAVALKVYKSYWLAVGACLGFTILLFVVLMQGSKVASDWWLSRWVNSTSANHTHNLNQCNNFSCNVSNFTRMVEHQSVFANPLILSDVSYTVILSGNTTQFAATESNQWRFYLMVYGIIAACNSVFTFIRSFAFAYGGIRAARVMHKNLLHSIMKAPISFFDTTPIGRVINRFSSDMYTIDDSLPFMLNIFLAQLSGLIATIGVTCYGLPYFTILLIPLSFFYYYTQRYYRFTSRDLKRLSSISLSPIYAHFTESLLGVATIRAFRKTEMFKERNIELVDSNQRCNFSTIAAQNWLAIRLQMMGVVMVTGVAFTAVLEKVFGTQTSVTAGMVGLALSYALSVTGRLSGVITSFTETEKQMVAVERLAYYIGNVPQERLVPFNEAPLSADWPSGGSIEFRNVSLRYRESLPYAIEKVSFKIEPGEKIGVVGRTGSGKSSLFLSLFGIVVPASGAIFIDGVNTSKVPLRTVRAKMAIIPQDPFLFNESVRSNLDPTGLVENDEQYWWALESCSLRNVVEAMGGLDASVGERGKRLSVGQRQLMCLARALLKDSRIVCLDEATANVDKKSDALLQETIRRQFSSRTLITIAHRIETILDSDRVLVMNDGKVAEFDSPEVLLQNPESLFAQLVKRSGPHCSEATTA